MKYSVMFGFDVEAKNMRTAQNKAKKNLKPKKDRQDIATFKIIAINKGIK